MEFRYCIAKSVKCFKDIIIGLIIAVVGGCILLYISPLFRHNNNLTSDINPPFFKIEKYKINVENENYTYLDTLRITVKYQGSRIIIRDDFVISNYCFNECYLFYKGEGYQDNPEIELLEVINSKPIVDSLNQVSEVLLQIKRKMIFDGNKIAYFDKEDKQIVGKVLIAYSYSFAKKTMRDTLETEIYLVRKN